MATCSAVCPVRVAQQVISRHEQHWDEWKTHPGTQVTFVVGTGVGQIHKLFKVPHLLWYVDEPLHCLILAIFEVQQGLHQGRFTVGLICGSTFGVWATHQCDFLAQALHHYSSHSHRESERFFMFCCRYWCRLTRSSTSPLATASNNLEML